MEFFEVDEEQKPWAQFLKTSPIDTFSRFSSPLRRPKVMLC